MKIIQVIFIGVKVIYLKIVKKIKFCRLDTLVKKIIKHNISYIHLDVESMETYALEGGIKLINQYYPLKIVIRLQKNINYDKI